MALLGDLDAVERMLRANPTSNYSADATARLADIRVAVTAYIEQRTGRTFGTVGASESVSVFAPLRHALAGNYGASALLLMPKPLRAITSVVSEPEWSGSGWIGGTNVPSAEYRPAMLTRQGDAMALELISGGAWAGRYIVTGLFADDDDDAVVPGEVEYVANLLISELFKYEQSSAAAQAGPDGQTLYLKQSTKHPVVCAILDKHTIVPDLVL